MRLSQEPTFVASEQISSDNLAIIFLLKTIKFVSRKAQILPKNIKNNCHYNLPSLTEILLRGNIYIILLLLNYYVYYYKIIILLRGVTHACIDEYCY